MVKELLHPVIIYQTFSTILSLAIGIFVLLNNPRNIINRIFFLLSIFITGYAGANLLIEYHTLILKDPAFAYKLAIFFASLHPPALVLFSWYFPRPNVNVNLRGMLLVWIIPLIFTSFSLTNFYVRKIEIINGIRFIDFGILYSIFAVNFCVFVIYSFLHLLKVYKISKLNIEKNQIRIVLIGLILAYSVGTIFSLLLPVYFHYSRTEFIGPIGPLILVIFLAYAITKTELMDIRVIINRTGAWIATVIFLGSIYLGLVSLYRTYISPQIDWIFLAWSIVYGILVGETFQRIRLFLQTSADKKFIKGWYDYRIVQRRLSERLKNVAEKEDVLPVVRGILDEELEIKEVQLVFPDENTDLLPFPILEEIKETKVIAHLPKESVLPKGLAVPCFSKGELGAVILVGPKRTEEPFSEVDFDLFRTLADEVLVIIQRLKPLEKARADLVVERDRAETAEEKVEIAQRELERSHRLASLGTLTAGLAHEIRNPMMVINSKAQLVLDKLDDKDYVANFAKMIPLQIERILDIVNRMLRFAKAKEEGLIKVDINNILEETLNLLASKIKDKSLEVKKEYKTKKIVSGNPNALSEAFFNIILNGIDFMQPGGTLTLRTNEVDGKIIVEIQDTGIGIPKDKIEHIFDPFFTSRPEGTGLGLSIAYKTIQEHKGEIKAASEVGKGSTFSIFLPFID